VKRKELFLMLVVAVMFGASPALACVLGPGQTYQEWTFDDNDNPAIPEIDMNPFGTATAAISGVPGSAPPEWVSDLADASGVWQAEQVIQVSLEIPNQKIRNPYKEILIEIGFLGDLEAFSVFPTPFGGTVELIEQRIKGGRTPEDWKKLTATYIIEPNPDSESICYSFAGNVEVDMPAVDYVRVNTVCVPEPLTMSLLGLGGLFVLRKRRA